MVIERFTVFVFEGAQAEAAAARAVFAVATDVVEVANFGFDGFFFAVAQQFDFDFFAYRGGFRCAWLGGLDVRKGAEAPCFGWFGLRASR